MANKINGADILMMEAAFNAPERQWLQRIIGRTDVIVLIRRQRHLESGALDRGGLSLVPWDRLPMRQLRLALEPWRQRIIRPGAIVHP